MKLIVGLGNPGKQYEKTRHNAGFIVLDELRRIWDFPEFASEKKFDSEISEMNHNGEKIILTKPQTFMNRSGEAVWKIIQFYKLNLEDIVVIHDDLDIELGKYKLSDDSSAAGHNGVQSTFDSMGTQKIKRVRVGIEGAEKKKERLMAGSDFVLQDFSEEELEAIKRLAEEISKEL
ncbi:MAG TPA: aminoacyl-tRNA hydrolase [Patescibacteria group bacterium]